MPLDVGLKEDGLAWGMNLQATHELEPGREALPQIHSELPRHPEASHCPTTENAEFLSGELTSQLGPTSFSGSWNLRELKAGIWRTAK